MNKVKIYYVRWLENDAFFLSLESANQHIRERISMEKWDVFERKRKVKIFAFEAEELKEYE